MRNRPAALLLLLVSMTACGGAQAPGTSGKRDACSAATLGLATARKLQTWKAPTGCQTPTGGGGQSVITSEEDFVAAFHCASGLDFTQHQLVVDERELSPAGVGGELFDDGTTVTYVVHDRSPCAGDPHPMPMRFTVMYLLPAGATRTFLEKSCTIESRCD